ncbi:MAG: hypothetical protein ABIT07_11810 [Ferruginibacter sp.]
MKISLLLLLITFAACTALKAQEILPNISVKNIGGKIIVSWRNEYAVPAANISIQRSYDSLNNYTTIGSVLNPLNKENGYADENPPYNKMYYRVFIAFEGGSYIITKPVRPVKDLTNGSDSSTIQKFPWQVNPFEDASIKIPPSTNAYPSRRAYTTKDNSVMIHLPEAAVKKYSIKFFDEVENLVFELTNLHEEYLIIEKVNFGHSGWFRFELYDAGTLVEKNKILIAKDGRNNR